MNLPKRVLTSEKDPLPEGTLSVGIGLVVAGITAYGFLAISARALGPENYAPLGVLWALMFVAGPGFFLPLEQEVGRALASRRAKGLGGGPLVRRAALAGGIVTLLLLAVTAISGPALVNGLFDGKTLLLVGFMVGLVAYFCEHLLRGTLSGNGRFGSYGLVVGAEAAVRMLGCAVLAVIGINTAGPYGVVLGAAPFVAVYLALRRERNLVTEGPDAPWSELSSAIGYLLAASVLGQLLVNSGVIAIQILSEGHESATAGRFLNGLIIARVPLFMFQAVQAALLPKLASHLGAGRHNEFRDGLRRLLAVVVALGAAATVGAFLLGPTVAEVLFGAEFRLGRVDFVYLAGASAAYMLALALAQALIALEAYGRVVIGWASGIVGFLLIVSAGSGRVARVEHAFLSGSILSAVVMGTLLFTRMAQGFTASADDLVAASHELALEP